MTSKEIEELQERVYKISCGMFPLDMFFNDIRDNHNPNFDKDLAYRDMKRIVDRVEKLEKAIKILKNSLGLDLEQFFADNEVILIQIKTLFESAELTKEEYELLEEVF